MGSRTKIGLLLLAGAFSVGVILLKPRERQSAVTRDTSSPPADELQSTGTASPGGGGVRAPAPAAVLSAGAKAVIASTEKHLGPSQELLSSLHPTDVSALIAEYDAQPLSNKVCVTWALAYLGGREVCEKFIETLETDYQGQRLDMAERWGIESIARALGLAGSSDEGIFRYITNHITPQSWTSVRTWNARSPKDQYPDVILAKWMLNAVGVSGRPDARAFLDSVLEWPKSELDPVFSGVIDGVFYASVAQTGDRKRVAGLFHSGERFQAFGEWAKTPEGKKYIALNGPLPDHP